MQNIYFDNAATTPIHPEVIEVISTVMANNFGNPSSIHSSGRKAKGVIEESRVTMAKYMGCSPSELYFTSCGTESNNIALRKAADCLGIKHFISTPIEHHSVLSTLKDIVKQNPDIELHLLEVDEKGNYALEQLEQLLQKHSNVMVSIMHVNNELGNLSDLNSIGALCSSNDALFHTDAVQTVGYFNFDLSNIDMLSASAHKFGGPKGIGILYMKKGTQLDALITGGGQERGLRAGTENVPYIAGMAKAMALCYDHLIEKSAHIKSIKSYFQDSIRTKLPQIKFNGDVENSHYTVLSVRVPVKEGADMFLFNLDLKGISASGGSACNSGASKGSHVMEAIGNSGDCVNLRFSFGINNTRDEVDYCLQSLKELMDS
jgi:cysteine desulfurase